MPAGKKLPGKNINGPFILRLLLVFVLIFFWGSPFGLQAAPAGASGLLEEIAAHVQQYYLYAPPGGVELHSLQDLPRLWQDPYSTYWDEGQFSTFRRSLEKSITGIGLNLKKDGPAAVTVVSAITGSPAHRAGIQGGDSIVSVDGRLVLDFTLEQVVSLLRGEAGTPVTLTLRRGSSQLLNFSLLREHIKLPSVEYTALPGKVALLRVHNFGEGTALEMSRLIGALGKDETQGMILDLRSNQGGYVEEALALANLFTQGPLLQFREQGTDWQTIQMQDTRVTSLPLVVLLNGGTASGAEIVAAALKDNGDALLVGEQTYGKGTIQTVFVLKHGGYLKLTTAEFASPRQTMIEGAGLEPHFIIKDPLKQEEMAAALLRSLQKQAGGGEGYLELWLQQQDAAAASHPRVLRDLQGEAYYPLRQVLALTGRPVLAGTKPGIYYFSWEGHDFVLNLNERLLTASTLPSLAREFPVLLHRGTTYVPLSFLENGLKLPFLQYKYP